MGALSVVLVQKRPVAVQKVCGVRLDQGETRATMDTNADTGCRGLSNRGGMLRATPGAGHHSLVDLVRVWNRLLARRCFALGDAGGGPESCEQKCKDTRDSDPQ